MTVQSALGQPLRAEVEVTSLSKDEAASLSVKLASPDAFKQAGLEYNAALASLRFAVDRRPDGRALVRITSAQPLNEPFVDLLVELNWATGKFVREYTFLLDPPELKLSRESNQDSGAAVVAPATGESSGAPATAAPAEAAAAPAERKADAARAAESTRAKPARAARAEPKPAPAEPAKAAGDVQVKAGDTLAQIAGRVKPQNVSLDQAIVAIYRANPSAFFGSVHQLKAGSTLSIPDEQTMGTVDAAAARSEVRVQARDFSNYRSRLSAAARTVPGAKAGQSASGSVSAKVDDQAQAPAQGDQLKLSRSAGGDKAAAAGAAGSKTAGAERRVANEAAVREAQARVVELERNVADLQRLLELKSKQLSDLQKAVDASKPTAPVVSGAVVKPEAKAPAAKAEAPKVEAPKAEAPKVEAPKAEAPKVEPPKAEALKAEALKAETPKAEAPKVEAPKAEAPKVEAPKAEAPKAEAPKAEAPKAEAPKAEAESEGGLLDEVMSNPLVLPGIGAILALGAGYAWYAMRRRKKEEKFEDSLIAAEGFTANSLFGSTGGQTGVDTHASAFASSRDTGADMHSTEVDPIAEAEVYIAYGREAQAEEILKEALKKQPERQAIRLKLLEIFAGRKDAKSFAAMANEMYGMTGGQNEEWPKVVTLGLAVDPDNPLYTGKAAGDAQSFGVTPQAPEPVAFEQPLEDEPPAASARAPSHDAGVPAAVAGLGAAAMGAAAAHATQSASERAPAASSAQEDVPALDFDLDLDAAIGKATSARESAKPSDLAKAVEGKFDLPTLELPGLSATGGAHAAEAADAELGDLKIDLPALEGLETEAVEQPQAIDLSAIGLDLQPSTLAPPPSADAARWQEMATKLDLASAYEEIGDKEGARELLQEVLKGGDTDQQQKARAMLSKIS